MRIVASRLAPPIRWERGRSGSPGIGVLLARGHPRAVDRRARRRHRAERRRRGRRPRRVRASPAADGRTGRGRRARARCGFADLAAEPRALAAVEPERPDNRFNDAAVDARGRFGPARCRRPGRAASAALYRVERRCAAGARAARRDDLERARLEPRRDPPVLRRLDDAADRRDRLRRRPRAARAAPALRSRSTRRDGLPDGLCVDADGGVWVALFGGGAIRRYRPDGQLDLHLPLPVTNPTSLAFGGARPDVTCT